MTSEEEVSISASVDDWTEYILKHQFEDFADARQGLKTSIIIDYDILARERYLDLGRQVLTKPTEAYKTAGRAAYSIMRNHYFDYSQECIFDYLDAGQQNEPYMRVGFKNIPIHRELSEITHQDVDKMISLKDFVVAVYEPRPYIKQQAMRCLDCNRINWVEIKGYQYMAKLSQCAFCDKKNLQPDDAETKWDDIQEVKIQEHQEKVQKGRIPQTKRVFVIGKDMLNLLTGGDYAQIDGIVKVWDNRKVSSDFFIEASYCQKSIDDRELVTQVTPEESVLTWLEPDNEEAFYQKLLRSWAPSVHGHDLEKEALLLQAAGSDEYINPDGTRHRGDINIGLWGSPRTGKTKLGEFTNQIYPRSVYISGQVTEVGFTASISFDSENGAARLEAGAYLLASSDTGGIVIADEMEKTKPEARRVLAGVMDDRQMISIQKANIHKEMRVHAASLHMANPKNGGAWDDDRDIYENTGFEAWYLGRFEAQYIFRDIVNEENDRKLTRHFLSQFGQKKGNQKGQDTFSVPDLRAWFLHVRKNYHPELIPNSQAAIMIEEEYLKLRKASKGFVNVKSEDGEAHYQRVTMSDVGALIRFAKASARACMRESLEIRDVQRAIRVVTGSIASASFGGQSSESEGLSADDKKLIKTIDIQASASKEFKMIEKKKQQQYKLFGKAVRKLGFTSCRGLCHGAGTYYEGSKEYPCPDCDGIGGQIHALDISYLEQVLRERGLSRMDVSDIATTYIRRGLLKETRDGRYKIDNITQFEISSKQLGADTDDDILSKIPESVTNRFSKMLQKQDK